jgi:hypothetical protein
LALTEVTFKREKTPKASGGPVTILFDQSPQHRLVEVEFEWEHSGSKYVETVHNSYAANDVDGYVFPLECRAVQTKDGKPSRAWTYVVKEAEFDRKIAPSIFTLSGINPPAGTRITDMVQNKAMEWDGSKAVEHK